MLFQTSTEAAAVVEPTTKEQERRALPKKGDQVGIIWTKDQREYEAEVVELEVDGDKPYCVVDLHGYATKETVWIEDLLPTR